MRSEDELLQSFVEIDTLDRDQFLKVKETLTRMGIKSNRYDTLYQSCHLLHKRGKYYITHFKELYELDGKFSSMDESDYLRRDKIASMLEEWGLVKVLSKLPDNQDGGRHVSVVKFSDKNKWNLESKYTMGR